MPARTKTSRRDWQALLLKARIVVPFGSILGYVEAWIGRWKIIERQVKVRAAHPEAEANHPPRPLLLAHLKDKRDLRHLGEAPELQGIQEGILGNEQGERKPGATTP